MVIWLMVRYLAGWDGVRTKIEADLPHLNDFCSVRASIFSQNMIGSSLDSNRSYLDTRKTQAIPGGSFLHVGRFLSHIVSGFLAVATARVKSMVFEMLAICLF